MANNRKRIFYPRNEGEVSPFYTNLAEKIAGAIGAKYGTDPAVIAKLNNHKVQIPAKSSKAYADAQIAKHSTALKKAELAEGKIEALRELNRITRLANWDEEDGKGLGIRKEGVAKDLKKVKPVIKRLRALPDKVIISYAKNGMDGVIVECLAYDPELKTIRWILIGQDSTAPFEDIRLNQSNQPESRAYRLRYIKNDQPVGVYSEVVEVLAAVYKAAEA